MIKSEFFQLLEENQSEIVMTNTEVKTIQRGSHVEIVLSVRGYGLFTLSRHVTGSQKLSINEAKFVRWFDEWSELPSQSVEGIELVKSDIVISEPECVVSLFDEIEFVSMRVLRERDTKKRPEFSPAKYTQQKKLQVFPQTSSQQFNAMCCDFLRSNYYLSILLRRINLSGIFTYVSFRRRRDFIRRELFHRFSLVVLLGVVRTCLGPPRAKVQ